MTSTSGDTPQQQLLNTLDVFLDHCVEPEFRQIVLLDSPAQFGPQRWEEPEVRRGSHHITRLLATVTQRSINDDYLLMLSSMFIGALIEAAKSIATDQDGSAKLAARAIICDWLEQLSGKVNTDTTL